MDIGSQKILLNKSEVFDVARKPLHHEILAQAVETTFLKEVWDNSDWYLEKLMDNASTLASRGYYKDVAEHLDKGENLSPNDIFYLRRLWPPNEGVDERGELEVSSNLASRLGAFALDMAYDSAKKARIQNQSPLIRPMGNVYIRLTVWWTKSWSVTPIIANLI